MVLLEEFEFADSKDKDVDCNWPFGCNNGRESMSVIWDLIIGCMGCWTLVGGWVGCWTIEDDDRYANSSIHIINMPWYLRAFNSAA